MSLFAALNRVYLLAQSAELGVDTIGEIFSVLSDFSGGCGVIIDRYGKILAEVIHQDTPALLKIKKSVDGRYIDSRLADRLRGITTLSAPHPLADFHRNSLNYYVAVQPMYAGTERIATIVLYKPTALKKADIELLQSAAAVVLLILRHSLANDAAGAKHDIDSVKQALGTLSYSELAAVLQVFYELGGNEGVLVVGKIADKLEITRSIIVNALRKLESSGAVETRSLGMKGTYIKVLNPVLFDELHKIRK